MSGSLAPRGAALGWENESMGFGRLLIVCGLILLALGVLMTLGERLPIRFGRLPGDIVIRGKNSVFYFPIMTSLLLSVVLSLILWIFSRR
jgi:hypothetical protein